MPREKHKFDIFRVDAEIESRYTKDILALAEEVERKLTRYHGQEEMKMMSRDAKNSAAAAMQVLLSRLNRLEKMQKADVAKINSAMKRGMDPETKAEFENIFQIELRIEFKTLNLERMMWSIFKKFKDTGDPRFAYSLIAELRKELKEEITEEEKIAAA